MESRTGKTVVIKIGTGVLTRGEGISLHHAMIARIVQSVADLVEEGHRCIVVSSGAVGAGLMALGLSERPKEVNMLQACAAIGQARLMQIYESQFNHYGLKVAQLLLTNEDFGAEQRRTNVRNTLTKLVALGQVVPIINENDSVAVFELSVGDNDVLSSKVAVLAEADLLILLTSVPGLLAPGETNPENIVEEVEDIEAVLDFASQERGRLSVGGMRSKLEAVKTTVSHGIETIIAAGANPEQLSELVAGQGRGTRFKPGKAMLEKEAAP